MTRRQYQRNAFTLIEILIVVIILGILAAVVIPQMTTASQDARRTDLASTVQTLRSQIEVYKLQHKDVVPSLLGGSATDSSNWAPLTTKTTIDGVASAVASDPGPYMHAAPRNPLVPEGHGSIVKAGDATTTPDGSCGFYQEASSGKVWGVDRRIDGTYALLGD